VGLLCWALPLPFLLGLYPIVRFPQEQIDIHVYPAHVVVEAWYVYRNPFPFPVVQGYVLPLPAGPRLPMPTDVWAKRVDAEDEIPLRLFRGTHRFTLAFAARATVTVYAVYCQPTPDQSAWYIIPEFCTGLPDSRSASRVRGRYRAVALSSRASAQEFFCTGRC
jgi:hypothetical protein